MPPDTVAPDGEMPKFQDMMAIPSLTGDQRKQINQFFQDCRSVTQPLNEEQRALEARQKELKAENDKAKAAAKAEADRLKAAKAPAAPAKLADQAPMKVSNLELDKGTAVPTPSATPDKKADAAEKQKENFEAMASHMSSPEIDARLPVLKTQTKDEYNKLTQKIAGVLTSDELGELDQMRRGTLMIVSDSPTDAPAPSPKPAAKPAPAKPAPAPHRQVHNASFNKHEIWQFLWGLR